MIYGRYIALTRRFNQGFRLEWRWYLIIAASTLLLQTEAILAPGYGHIPAGLALLGVAGGLMCFLFLWAALQPQMPRWLDQLRGDLPPAFRHPVWRVLLLIWAGYLAYQIIASPLVAESFRGFYRIDAIAYAHLDGDLLLRGQNPYTADDAFWDAYRRWPQALSTPLMGDIFGTDPLKYPHNRQMDQQLLLQSAHPASRGDAFDPTTVHNYPAGIIWLELPLLIAGVPSMVWLNVLAWIAAIAIVMARAPTSARWSIMLVLLLSPVALRSVIANFDVVPMVFVLAAWHWMSRQRVSPLLLGFACAVKQLSWFFLPFYFLDVFQREGWRGVFRRGLWSAVGFLIPNVPFILMSPVAWFRSIWVPLTDPMFPFGSGAVALSFGGLFPILSAHAWTLIELSVMLGLLVVQYRRRSLAPESLVLALVPLWFAWRSPLNYFAWLPMLATYVIAFRLSLREHIAQPGPITAVAPPTKSPATSESVAL